MFTDNIINSLVEEKSRKSMIEKIRNDNIPIILYGAGDLASYIIDYLKKKAITISAICVDKEYLKNENFLGIKVYSVEDVLTIYSSFNLVIANAYYLTSKKKMEQYKQIKGIYFITDPPYHQWNKIPMEFIKRNIEKYNTAYNNLEDAYSKQCMVAYLNSRINDDSEYVFCCVKDINTYFNNNVFKLNNNEFYLDVGAYIGQSIKKFIDSVDKKYKKIVALEPNSECYNIIKSNESLMVNMDLYNIGVWSEEKIIYISESDDQCTEITEERLNSNSQSIKVTTLDNIFDSNKYDDLTIMKINYCHGVKECLLGAERIIKKYRPKLAIRVGFEELNVAEIPNLLKSFIPDYKIYLRYCLECPAGLLLLAV